VSVYLLNRKIQSIRFRRLLREAEHRHAVDRERLRISRDMHDEIGSSLTQVAILSELAKQRSGDPAEVARLTARIGEISGQALDEMGEIIWTMNPKNDNLASFASYVRQHAVEYLDAAGIRAVVDFPDDPPPLTMNAEQRRHFYLLIKEALHNIVRHAGARTVQFRMQQEGNRLTVEISDDGRGFDPVTSPGGGNGLPGMRRRAETLKGELVVDSSPGKGVRILFSAPLDENHPNR
jgi:signal transduction histidine kinase